MVTVAMKMNHFHTTHLNGVLYRTVVTRTTRYVNITVCWASICLFLFCLLFTIYALSNLWWLYNASPHCVPSVTWQTFAAWLTTAALLHDSPLFISKGQVDIAALCGQPRNTYSEIPLLHVWCRNWEVKGHVRPTQSEVGRNVLAFA